MSRKYLNEKWCVRCNRNTPCPYLKKNWKLLTGKTAVDIGCGNGRNSKYLYEMGYDVVAFDMSVKEAQDKKFVVSEIVLGKDELTVPNKWADVILANYVFMFLNKKEMNQVIKQIQRISHEDTHLMIELYPAKDSEYPTQIACEGLQDKLLDTFDKLGWHTLRCSKNKFILEKTV